jgi:hypothetical protein
MKTSEKDLYKSTGKITREDLDKLYHNMSPADIVLRLAEHKNFDAARAEFETWDDHSVIQMDNFFIQNYRLDPATLYASRDEYIAANFLKSLISEWDKKQNEQQTVIEKLPILVIRAVPFIIDPYKRQLIRFNDPEKIISFDDLKFNNSFYFLDFDTITFKPAIDLRGPEALADRVISVTIPATIIDAPAKLPKDRQDDMNRRSQALSWEFYLGDKNVALRLSGVLPHIDLAGTDFTIDWRLKELRETEEPWKNISLRDMEMSESGEEYLCFYNKENHDLFEPGEDLLEMPENVVVLEIPYEIMLDPVAVAREYGIGDTDLLAEHPFQMKLTAKVTSLLDSGLPEFIENNLKALNNTTPDRNSRRGR